MKIRVLGCSGGIGGHHLRTTSFLVDHDILIDAGTGVGDLSIAELAQIDHVFITHSHLDHVVSLAFMVDAVGDMRDKPLTVHATEATIQILREHVFNWLIWPDFSKTPVEKPFLHYSPISVAETVTLEGRMITALPANHTVPAVGFQLNSGSASLVFSGDTGSCPEFWEYVNRISNLRYLIIECAFPDQELALAKSSKHLCPSLLMKELTFWQHPYPDDVGIYITHLKPGQIEMTMQELAAHGGSHQLQILQGHQGFDI